MAPQTAFAAGTAVGLNAAQMINNVQVSFEVPEAGQSYFPKDLVSVPEGADYEVEYAAYYSEDPYDESTEAAGFNEGDTCTLLVTLKADDAFDFAEDASAEIECDANNTWWIEDIYNASGGSTYSAMVIIIEIQVPEGEFQGMISQVTLYVTPPLAGTDPDIYEPDIAYVSNEGYHLSDFYWCDAQGKRLADPAVFEAGKTYYAGIELTANDGCWWNQISPADGDAYDKYGSLNVDVNDGELIGNLSATNSTDGCWATGIIAVAAVEAPEGLITSVEIGFTPPETGTVVSAAFTSFISQDPAPAVTFPENADYKCSEYISQISGGKNAIWVEDVDQNGTLLREEDFTIEAGKTYYAIVQVEAAEGCYFDDDYTSVQVENAWADYIHIIDNGKNMSLCIFFDAEEDDPIDPPVEYDYFSLWISDINQTPNTGGGVKIEYLLDDGTMPPDSGKIWTESTNQTMPQGTLVTLTALADEGYVFKGWYQANINKQGVNDPHYLADKFVSAEPVYSFSGNPVGEGESPYICAVFEKSDKPSRQGDQVQMWVGNTDGRKGGATVMGGKVAVKYTPSEPNIYNIAAKDGTDYVAGEILQFYKGDECTVYAKPDAGYKFVGWYHVNLEWGPEEGRPYQGEVISTASSFTYKPGITVISGDTEALRYVCAVFEKATEQKIAVQGIKFNTASLEMGTSSSKKMSTEQLQVTFTPSNSTNKGLIWVSSDPDVVRVDQNGNITALKYGKVTITATSKDNPKAVAKCTVQTRFNDVNGSNGKGAPDYQYYFDPVYWAANNNITKGYKETVKDGTKVADSNYFGPARNCTRAEMIIFMWRASGRPSVSGSLPFSDTKSYKVSSDTYKAILWGYTKGIIKGYTSGKFKGQFRPNDPVVRKDCLIMLYRLAGKPSVSGSIKFPDVKAQKYKPSSDTYKAILWGTKKGITAGYADGNFQPFTNCQREHIVTFLWRYKGKPAP